jgi:hypothetical protein
MVQPPNVLYLRNGTIVGMVVSCERCHQLVVTELSVLVERDAEEMLVPIQPGLFGMEAAREGALEPHICSPRDAQLAIGEEAVLREEVIAANCASGERDARTEALSSTKSGG